MQRSGRLRIGTSGWVYRHWKGAFYPADVPAKRWFEHYRTVFDTVELNTPFYHLPRPTAVARWRDETPPDFAFAVKGSRFITHNKKLKDPHEPLERFFELMDGLDDKMAVVLWQLPPSWGFDAERLDAFLRAFRKREGARRTCFEFRNQAWYCAEALAILRRHDAGFCIYDLGGHTSPLELTADFAYVRLHGPVQRYSGAYGERGLAPWAERIGAWRARGIDVFAYFDNDVGGAAPRDALTLRRLCGGEAPRAAAPAASATAARRARPAPRRRQSSEST
jgi:uncharacterized protein YecE (DUF72 family)